MNKNVKLKSTIITIIMIMFACVISAGWVTAQSAQVKPATPAAAAPKVIVPQKTSKLFGPTGRPDPFIVITGAAAKMNFPSAGQSSTGQVKSGQGGVEGYAGGAVLTGTFIVNGKKYALIKFGDQTKICQVGTQVMGFKVTKISSKKVTIVSKAGAIELKIEDYLMKNQAPNNMQAPSSFGGDSKSLVPPPMQAPTQTQLELPGASNVPATQQQGQPEPSQ